MSNRKFQLGNLLNNLSLFLRFEKSFYCLTQILRSTPARKCNIKERGREKYQEFIKKILLALFFSTRIAKPFFFGCPILFSQ
jgi:hypothetical protein